MVTSIRRVVLSLALAVAVAAPLVAQQWRGGEALGLTVEDEHGHPVAGAEVRLHYLLIDSQAGPAPLATDDAGRLVVAGLARGTWRLELTHAGNADAAMMVRLGESKKPQIVGKPTRSADGVPMRVKFFRVNGAEALPPAPAPPEMKPAPPPTPAPAPAPVAPKPPAPKPPAPSPRPMPQQPKTAPAPSKPPEPEPAPEPPPPQPKPAPTPAPTPAPAAPAQAAEAPAEAAAPSAPAPAVTPPAAAPEAPTPAPTSPPAPEPASAPPQPMPEQAKPAPAMPPLRPAKPAAPPAPAEAPAATPKPVPPPEPPPPMLPPQKVAPPPAPIADAAPAAPGAAPQVASTLRGPGNAVCNECKPGESAVAVEQVVAPGGSLTDSTTPCAPGVADAVRQAAAYLAPAARAGYAGSPLHAGSADATSALAAFTSADAACQVVAVVLPPGAKYTGYLYEATDETGSGSCAAGGECEIGACAWAGHPEIVRSTGSTVVYGVFRNASPDLPRRARLTVYFSR
jgi:hypothetical protein